MAKKRTYRPKKKMVYAENGAGLTKAGNIVSTAAPLLNMIPGIGPLASLAAKGVGAGLSFFGNKKQDEFQQEQMEEQEKQARALDDQIQSDQILASFNTEGNNQKYFAMGGRKRKGLWANIRAKKKRLGKKDLGTKADGTVTDEAMMRSQAAMGAYLANGGYTPYPYQDQPRTMINPTLEYDDGGKLKASDVAIAGGARSSALMDKAKKVPQADPKTLIYMSETREGRPDAPGPSSSLFPQEGSFVRKSPQEFNEDLIERRFGPQIGFAKGGSTSRSLYEIVTSGDTHDMWKTQSYNSPKVEHANHPANVGTHRDNVDYDTWKKQLSSYAKGGSVPGGDLVPMGKDKVVVDGDNPQRTDDVQYKQNVMVDDGEVIQDKANEAGERVFSDSKDMVIPGTGKTPAQLVKSLESRKRMAKGGKTGDERYKSHNQRIDKEIDKVFQIQQMMNGGSTGEPAMANGGGTDPGDAASKKRSQNALMRQYTSGFDTPASGPIKLQDRSQGTEEAWRNLAPEKNPYSELAGLNSLDAIYQYQNTNPAEAERLLQKVNSMRGDNPAYTDWTQFSTTEFANPTIQAEIDRRERQSKMDEDATGMKKGGKMPKWLYKARGEAIAREKAEKQDLEMGGYTRDGGKRLFDSGPSTKKNTSQEHSARRDTSDQGRTYKTGSAKDPVRKVHYKRPKTEAPSNPNSALKQRNPMAILKQRNSMTWSRKGRMK